MKKGFTLLELLVVISIIMVLTVSGVAAYSSVSKNSRDARRKSDIEQLRQALEMFRSDQGYYPSVNTGALATANNLNTGNATTGLYPNYSPSIPVDPRFSTSNPYLYRATNLSNAQYYGYCLCTVLEAASAVNNNCGSLTPAVGTPGGAPANTFYYCVRSP
jgi:type II secretion system protein G